MQKTKSALNLNKCEKNTRSAQAGICALAVCESEYI